MESNWAENMGYKRVNILMPQQNGRRFLPDDILKFIFLTESVSILIQISLKFVIWGSTNIHQ